MDKPQATSFHGDPSRAGGLPRAAPDDPEVYAAIREAERIVLEAQRGPASIHRAGPNVLGPRRIRR